MRTTAAAAILALLTSGCMTAGLVHSTFRPVPGSTPRVAGIPVALNGAGLVDGPDSLHIRLILDDGGFRTAAVGTTGGAVFLAASDSSFVSDRPALPRGTWLAVDSLAVCLDPSGSAILVRRGPKETRHELVSQAVVEEESELIYWGRIFVFPIFVPLTVAFDALTIPAQLIWAFGLGDGLESLVGPRAQEALPEEDSARTEAEGEASGSTSSRAPGA